MKPALSSARDHAEPVEAALDVRQRLLVLEVVAGDQAVDDLAGDAELAGPEALDLELARRRGAVDAVLGELVGGVERHRLGDRHAAQQLDRELVEALAGGGGGDEHRHVVQPPAPLRGGGLGLLRA